jgi:hypothetical protein
MPSGNLINEDRRALELSSFFNHTELTKNDDAVKAPLLVRVIDQSP